MAHPIFAIQAKAFRIDSKDIAFKGPLKMKKRFHGDAVRVYNRWDEFTEPDEPKKKHTN